MSAPYTPALPPNGCPWASPAGWHAAQTAALARRPARNGQLPAPFPAATPRLIRQRGPYAHVLSPYAEPITSVRPGETVAIQTIDCFGGRLTREDQVPSEVFRDAPLNPLTGPIWIEGAEPGDTLVVHIVDIRPVGERAVSCLLPYCGV